MAINTDVEMVLKFLENSLMSPLEKYLDQSYHNLLASAENSQALFSSWDLAFRLFSLLFECSEKSCHERAQNT